MYTIALLAQKGGTGKTTLAVHVAADFEGAGGSAALVDLDPQASAALWGDRRGRSPFVGAVPAARRSGAGLVVIDTAPHSESAARQDDGSRRGRRARLRGPLAPGLLAEGSVAPPSPLRPRPATCMEVALEFADGLDRAARLALERPDRPLRPGFGVDPISLQRHASKLDQERRVHKPTLLAPQLNRAIGEGSPGYPLGMFCTGSKAAPPTTYPQAPRCQGRP